MGWRKSILAGGVYPHIDLQRTGRHLEELIRQRGYTVKDIQRLLHLSCPQPIYRWIRGQILPSVDHLFMLSKLLQVHMEELLIMSYGMREETGERQHPGWRRMFAYGREYLWRKMAWCGDGYVSFYDRFREYL